MTYAFDAHMHILPLGHVSLSAYLEYAQHNPISEAYAQVSAHDYVVAGILKKQGEVRNLVAVMEQPVEKHLEFYEDDLRGIFSGDTLPSPPPIADDSGVHIRGAGKDLHYEKIMLCPLLMDFSFAQPLNLYYSEAPEHDILTQAHEVLEGIERYHQNRPHGILDTMPFLGINPLNHGADYTQNLLETCFPAKTAKNILLHKKGNFAGIKVYPPMGFDPDPSDPVKAEKAELLFAFCEENSLPIVTHCDDQGFRLLPLEDSLRFTSPSRWVPVLERHPDLYLDFAHFGEQYYHGPVTPLAHGIAKIHHDAAVQENWREKILELMLRYPHVYADLSFDGVNAGAWKGLMQMLEGCAATDRDVYEKRLMFGTDWPLSLAKTQSALHYWNAFAESPIDELLTHKMLCENPRAFLQI